MLATLAKNPVFAANPACLADFVRALVQPTAQTIPTPMSKANTPPMAPAPAATEGVKQEANQEANQEARDMGESQSVLEARKQFWSKFKRPTNPSMDVPKSPPAAPEPPALLSLPTLVLGESASATTLEYEQCSPVMAEPVMPDSQAPDDTQPTAEPMTPKPAGDVSSTGLWDNDVGKLAADSQDRVPSPEQPASPAPSPPQPVEVLSDTEPPLVDPQTLPEQLPDRLSDSQNEPMETKDDMQPKETEAGPQAMETTVDPEPKKTSADPQPMDTEPDACMSPAPSASMPPPATPPAHKHVGEALRRVTTVDLENGQTPAPPQSLVAPESPGVSTVVLLTVAGTVQPVTVPMTPHQCKLAGLKIANDVGESTDTNQSEQPTAPDTTVKQPADDDDDDDVGGGSNLSSKQMLKNLYMRFSRSQKRFLVVTYHLSNVNILTLGLSLWSRWD